MDTTSTEVDETEVVKVAAAEVADLLGEMTALGIVNTKKAIMDSARVYAKVAEILTVMIANENALH